MSALHVVETLKWEEAARASNLVIGRKDSGVTTWMKRMISKAKPLQAAVVADDEMEWQNEENVTVWNQTLPLTANSLLCFDCEGSYLLSGPFMRHWPTIATVGQLIPLCPLDLHSNVDFVFSLHIPDETTLHCLAKWMFPLTFECIASVFANFPFGESVLVCDLRSKRFLHATRKDKEEKKEKEEDEDEL